MLEVQLVVFHGIFLQPKTYRFVLLSPCNRIMKTDSTVFVNKHTELSSYKAAVHIDEKVSDFDQEMPQSQITDQPTAPGECLKVCHLAYMFHIYTFLAHQNCCGWLFV